MLRSFSRVERCDIRLCVIFGCVDCVVIIRCHNEMSDIKQQVFCYGNLYCIVLYCIVLYCIVLYCIVLYCVVLYCVVLYCIVLCCIVLYCIAKRVLFHVMHRRFVGILNDSSAKGTRKVSAVPKAAKSVFREDRIHNVR
jgi:hypothetical protein